MIEVTRVKNSTSRIGGFSPAQWVLGRDSRTAPSQFSQEWADLQAIEAQADPDSIFALQHQARVEARKAFVHLDCSRRVQKALLRNAQPIPRDYAVGDLVCFRRDNQIGGTKWSPACRVIGKESEKNVWLLCGNLPVLANAQNLRPASDAEALARSLLRGEMVEVPETVVGDQSQQQSFVDARRVVEETEEEAPREKKSRRIETIPEVILEYPEEGTWEIPDDVLVELGILHQGELGEENQGEEDHGEEEDALAELQEAATSPDRVRRNDTTETSRNVRPRTGEPEAERGESLPQSRREVPWLRLLDSILGGAGPWVTGCEGVTCAVWIWCVWKKNRKKKGNKKRKKIKKGLKKTKKRIKKKWLKCDKRSDKKRKKKKRPLRLVRGSIKKTKTKYKIRLDNKTKKIIGPGRTDARLSCWLWLACCAGLFLPSSAAVSAKLCLQHDPINVTPFDFWSGNLEPLEAFLGTGSFSDPLKNLTFGKVGFGECETSFNESHFGDDGFWEQSEFWDSLKNPPSWTGLALGSLEMLSLVTVWLSGFACVSKRKKHRNRNKRKHRHKRKRQKKLSVETWSMQGSVLCMNKLPARWIAGRRRAATLQKKTTTLLLEICSTCSDSTPHRIFAEWWHRNSQVGEASCLPFLHRWSCRIGGNGQTKKRKAVPWRTSKTLAGPRRQWWTPQCWKWDAWKKPHPTWG